MEYIVELLARYRSKGLLIDTNLLLLYIIGIYDQDRIPKFKRTMTFTIDEFLLLSTVFDSFDKIITTPSILTEVSNLSGQLPNKLHSYFYSEFAIRIPILEERYTYSGTISASDHFNKFGLTDSGIVDVAKDNYLVLTDDLKLFGYLQNLGIDAINFNHIRSIAW
jgi:hypothetical protein